MPPLGKLVVGLLLVIADFRIDGFDVVPDVIGWLVVLAGLLPLAGRSRGFAAAGAAAAVGVLLALPQLVAPPGPLPGFLEGVAETVMVFGTCTGVIALVTDPRVRRTANTIRWADLAVFAVGTVLGLGADGSLTVAGATAGLLLVLVVVTLGIVVWFLVFVWSQRHRPELSAGLRTGEGSAPGTP
jgi:hypothetical protein